MGSKGQFLSVAETLSGGRAALVDIITVENKYNSATIDTWFHFVAGLVFYIILTNYASSVKNSLLIKLRQLYLSKPHSFQRTHHSTPIVSPLINISQLCLIFPQ